MNQSLSPEQLINEGKAAYEQEDFLEAAQAFEAAAQGFTANEEPLLAAEANNNRSVALLQAGEAEAALAAVGETPALFAQAGDLKRQAMALGNRAAALAELGRRKEAEAAYWESAKLLGELGEKDLRASVLQSISRLQMGSGRFMEAMASMEAGIDERDTPSFTQRMLKKLLAVPKKLLNRGS